MEEKITYKTDTPLDLAKSCVKILDGRHAKNMSLLFVESKTIIADYFVICSGNSNTQIKALAGELEYQLADYGIKPLRTDGLPEASWVVVDFGSVLVHIFNSETRDFYNLDKLYSDTESVDITDLLTD